MAAISAMLRAIVLNIICIIRAKFYSFSAAMLILRMMANSACTEF